MADVFISYARNDIGTAERVLRVLAEFGLDVWTDSSLEIGTDWARALGDELASARCVLVLWSATSASSAWVERESAAAAAQSAVVIPVLLDDTPLPLHLAHIQAADLRSFRNGTGDQQQADLIRLAHAVQSQVLGAVELGARGVENASEYLDALAAESAKLNEVKVLFIGDGGAGKTSLLKRIAGRAFDRYEPQTHGITIERGVLHLDDLKRDRTSTLDRVLGALRSKSKNPVVQVGGEDYVDRGVRRSVRVNLWDFGGQEIMHSTHQFFLSKRSLYVLVLDGRKEEDPEYWLQHVRAFGGKSPILVVLNKLDENPSFEVNRRFLQDKYPNVHGFHRLSCLTGEGVDRFSSALRSRVGTLENLTTVWPSSWFRVKSRVESLDSDYISYDRYIEICQREGLDSDEKFDALVAFLNDLGVVLHVNSPILRETSVINPEWATGGVYRIINSRQLAEGRGVLELSLLGEILDQRTYPRHKHDYVVELMKKFELAYSVDSDHILIPDLLPVEEPEFEFNFLGALRYRIRFDFLPKSTIPRFVVKLNSDIKENLRWRTGVVLADASFASGALVRGDAREKVLSLWVQGDGRLEYFSVLRKALLDITSGFPGLRFSEEIPCNCKRCSEVANPHFFEYDYIVRRRRKGKLTVDCHASVEEVEIERLLAGIESEQSVPPSGWDVFLSYSSEDTAIVSRVVADLESRGVSCWWDKEQVRPGESISLSIEMGLRGSKYVVPCLSRNQIRSGWCRAEYQSVLARVFSGRTSQRVVPLIIDDLEDGDLPLLLSDLRVERLSVGQQYRRFLSTLTTRL